jgi:hypothetical protein
LEKCTIIILQTRRIFSLYLDLEADNVTHHESKSASNSHRNPELCRVEEGEIGKGAELASNDHKRNENQAGVDVVVISQLPDIIVNLWQDFLGVNGVEGDAGRSNYTVSGSNDGK